MNTGAFMHDLLDWIDNNLDSRLDIESVARRSGYSKWHLQRLFKEGRVLGCGVNSEGW
jgi:AraC family transcriptional activator of mar-sox-rob regulon